MAKSKKSKRIKPNAGAPMVAPIVPENADAGPGAPTTTTRLEQNAYTFWYSLLWWPNYRALLYQFPKVHING